MSEQNFIQDKSKLRSELIKKRSTLSNSQAKDLSNKIILKLVDYIDWRKINSINAYQAVKSKKEVDVSGLLNFLKQNHPKVHVDLAPDKASESQNVPKSKTYDLVIVPVVGFDRSGNRLGYGGGYYDKFLARNNCGQSVGLVYSFQEVENLPAEDHDQKLDLIVTEKEIIKP